MWVWGTLGSISATPELAWEQGIQSREEDSWAENGVAVPRG